MDPHQANLQPHLLLSKSPSASLPLQLSLESSSNELFSKHVSSLKAKFFLCVKALCCVSASSLGPFQEPLSCMNLFFGTFSLMLHPYGFLSKLYQRYQIRTPSSSGQSRHHLPLVFPYPSLLSEASLPPLQVTLTHFALMSGLFVAQPSFLF